MTGVTRHLDQHRRGTNSREARAFGVNGAAGKTM